MAEKVKLVRAWAWVFPERNAYGSHSGRWLLCFWAEPDKDRLVRRSKPTSDAKAIRVEIRPAPKRKKAKRKA